MKPTKEQIKGVIDMTLAVAATIQELKQVPSGHLYAQLMGRITLDDWYIIVNTLKQADVIKESNHLLIWTGPMKGTQK